MDIGKPWWRAEPHDKSCVLCLYVLNCIICVPLDLLGCDVCECRYLMNLSLDISSASLPSLVYVELSAGARQCRSWSEALPHSSEAVPHLEFTST
jgi:hypothetical protein